MKKKALHVEFGAYMDEFGNLDFTKDLILIMHQRRK